MFGKKRQPQLLSIGPLENEALRVVSKRGTATADEVRRELEKTRSVKESTVRTLLRRLEEKGFLTHDVDGRTNVHLSTESRAAECGDSGGTRDHRPVLRRVGGGPAGGDG